MVKCWHNHYDSPYIFLCIHTYIFVHILYKTTKENPAEAVSQGEEDKQEEEEEELDGEGRRRRKRKVPKRYAKMKICKL